MVHPSARTSPRAAWILAATVLAYLALAFVAGAPDSPLVPRLPAGVGIPRWTRRGAEALGLGRLSRIGLSILAIGLLAALVAAFGWLVLEAVRGRVGLGAAALAGVASLAITVAAPLLLSRDVYSYAVYGRLFGLHGANPYVAPPAALGRDPFLAVVSPQWRTTRSVYGPAFTLLAAGVARATAASPGATILAFKLVSGLGAAGAGGVALLWCRRAWPARAAAAAVLTVLNPVIVVHTVGGGHNDTLVGLLLVAAGALVGWRKAAAWTASGGRWMWAFAVTALLTLATLVKVVAAIPLVLWLSWLAVGGARRVAPRAQPWVAAANVGVAVALGAALSAPFVSGARSLRGLATLAAVEGWASGPHVVARGVQALVGAFGASTGAEAGRVVEGLFLLLFVVVLLTLARRLRPDRPAAAWAPALVCFALAAPYLLPWYVAWFVPLLALVEDGWVLAAGVALSGLLALSGVPAEAGSAPATWRDMMLGVHYGLAPAMLVLLGVVVARTLRQAPSFPELPAGRRPGLVTTATPIPPPKRP